MRNYLLLYVNGKRHKIFGENGFKTLSDFLRKDLSLVGTKVVCAEGDCGSCTVLLGRMKSFKNGKIELRYQSIDSCIQYLYQLDCSHIITVEALRKTKKNKLNLGLNEVQKAMVKAGGSQCGYCTPGFVMSLSAMLELNDKLTRDSILEGLTGNLCRCTGYDQIISAALSIDITKHESITKLFNSKAIIDDLKREVMKSVFSSFKESWNGVERKFKYFIPTSMYEALEFKKKNNVTVVAGGTDISVQMNKGRIEPNSVLSLTHLEEMEKIEINNRIVNIGAKVTWTKLEKVSKKYVPQFYKIIKVFASKQIKNEGTLAGNIANGSPIADSLPFLYVIDSEIELSSVKQNSKKIEKRWLNINNFFRGYKKLNIRSNELITKVRWKIPEFGDILKLYKVSKRKDLDISTFTAGIMISLKEGKIQKARLAFGGVAPVILRLPKVEKFLQGKPMLGSIFKEAGSLACNEISPISDVRASSEYRLNLSENIFQKFFYEWQEEKNNKRAA
tara:strand:+ start:313 stop:1824 length:1512 start_codon:yes stop_codon:yes gene_type:complete